MKLLRVDNRQFICDLKIYNDNESESFKHHSEHFVVNYSELSSVCGPAEVDPTHVSVFYFVGTLKVVSNRKGTVRIVVRVAVIRNV